MSPVEGSTLIDVCYSFKYDRNVRDYIWQFLAAFSLYPNSVEGIHVGRINVSDDIVDLM